MSGCTPAEEHHSRLVGWSAQKRSPLNAGSKCIQCTFQAAMGSFAPFAVGFGVTVFAAFALSFVVYSCLILVVMAPTSALQNSAA
jgi:hypothetical protein